MLPCNNTTIHNHPPTRARRRAHTHIPWNWLYGSRSHWFRRGLFLKAYFYFWSCWKFKYSPLPTTTHTQTQCFFVRSTEVLCLRQVVWIRQRRPVIEWHLLTHTYTEREGECVRQDRQNTESVFSTADHLVTLLT